MAESNKLNKSLGTWEVMVSGVALVVASTTLVSDFTGYFTLGIYFSAALLLGFIINLLLGLSTSELAVSYPKAGIIYNYSKAILGNRSRNIAGVFLGLTFWAVCSFAVSGETVSGAYALRTVIGSEYDISYFIIIVTMLAIIPNILGIKTLARVNMSLLLFMLGIRWLFGISGFLNLSNSGQWSLVNLIDGYGSFQLFGESGILILGLSLAIWSFIGIEFSASLAEEVKNPRKSIPRGIVFGLIIILITSLIMGVGVTGTHSQEYWKAVINSPLGNNAESPHLAVGFEMFGEFGLILMSLASIAATLGSITMIYAGMPRILFSIARDGQLINSGISSHFAKLHGKYKTPVNAVIFTMAVYILPALYSGEVIKWIYSAAYIWLLLYAVIHILALLNRKRKAGNPTNKNIYVQPIVGICLTIGGLYFAFAGNHGEFGLRALGILLIAFAVTAASFTLFKKKKVFYPEFTITAKEIHDQLVK